MSKWDFVCSASALTVQISARKGGAFNYRTLGRTVLRKKERPAKYPDQHAMAKDLITTRWNEGGPISREEIYDELAEAPKRALFRAGEGDLAM